MADDTYDAFVTAYNNFDYRPLKGASMRRFYVDDFTKDTTDSIVKTVQISERFRKILIIGHRGCGKSTILNKVAENLQNQYHIVSFSVTEEMKKDVLIIIDDLDKLQDETTCERIFFKETQLLIMPEAKIIFTFPLFAYYSPSFRQISAQFTDKFIQLVNLYDIDGNYQKTAMTILKKLVLKRIEPTYISDEAMKDLIDKSGGLLRDLIQFMQDACKIVIDQESSVINAAIVKKVIQNKINEYNRIFNFPEYKEIVRQIIQTKNKEAILNEDVIYLLRYLFVMEYGSSGEQSWYDAHPCLKACFED